MNATAPDGVIEGIEAPAYRFCIGVQWHPEFLISEGDAKLFRAFLGAAAADVSEHPKRRHRQAPGARRPLLAPRCRALDRSRPRQGRRQGAGDAGLCRDRSERHRGRRQAIAASRPGPPVALSQAPQRDGDGARSRRTGAPSSTRCPRACRASSRSAASTTCPKACCCSPTMAASPASSNCRPTAGRGAIAPACTALSTRRSWPPSPTASPSRACATARSRQASIASSAPMPGSTSH